MGLEEKEGGEGLDLERLVSSAVSQGLGSIVKNHPKFRGLKLNDYLDNDSISKYAGDFTKKLQKVPDKKKQQYVEEFYNDLKGYAASGKLFNEKGQELVLRKSWEKKSKGVLPTKGKGEAKELLQGEKYLEGIMASFTELYGIMAGGDYAQRMPELAKAIKTVYDGGFFDASLNVLYANGRLDKGRYLTMKQALRKKVDDGVRATTQQLEHYLSQAAVVFGGVGLVVVLSIFLANGITGNVIGITSGSSLPALVFGGIALIAGIFLWSKRRK